MSKDQTRAEFLKSKIGMSMSAVFDMPVGGHVYKLFCVLPGDSRYFESDEEVDECLSLIYDERQ